MKQYEYYKKKIEFKKTRLGSQPGGEGVPLYIIHSPTSHVQQMGVAWAVQPQHIGVAPTRAGMNRILYLQKKPGLSCTHACGDESI